MSLTFFTKVSLIGMINFTDSASRDEQSALGQSDRADLPQGKGDDVETALLERSISIGHDESLCRSRGSFPEALDVSVREFCIQTEGVLDLHPLLRSIDHFPLGKVAANTHHERTATPDMDISVSLPGVCVHDHYEA